MTGKAWFDEGVRAHSRWLVLVKVAGSDQLQPHYPAEAIALGARVEGGHVVRVVDLLKPFDPNDYELP